MLSLIQNSTLGCFDLASINGQLECGDADLPTIFLLALFTSNVPTNGFQNWCGNSFISNPIGSPLMKLLRGTKSGKGSIANQARDYANQALSPFVKLGLLTSLSVQSSWSNTSGVGLLAITITVITPTINSPINITYNINPNGTAFIVK